MTTIEIPSWDHLEPVLEFNNGNSRIVVDDRCYVLLNKTSEGCWKSSPWISPEALNMLKKLPPVRVFLEHPAHFQSPNPEDLCRCGGPHPDGPIKHGYRFFEYMNEVRSCIDPANNCTPFVPFKDYNWKSCWEAGHSPREAVRMWLST